MTANNVDLRTRARAQTEMALRVLCRIAKSSKSDAARVSAAALLLDRGWGKAPQAFVGENGEGAIAVIIRHIVESVPAPGQRTIEHAPLANGGDTSADDNNRDA